jgi:hypothetical protein
MIYNVSGRKYLRRIYVGFVVDIDIKIFGGVFPALLFVGALFLLEVFSHASSQQHGAYNRKGNVKYCSNL